uniref:Uncharacterized protein n=1 Tax=Schizaphis graminum TaxID=13262 RepID=A0A2S2PR69_SCHGA
MMLLIQKKKKTVSMINSILAKTMTNKTSLVNDPNTINSEDNSNSINSTNAETFCNMFTINEDDDNFIKTVKNNSSNIEKTTATIHNYSCTMIDNSGSINTTADSLSLSSSNTLTKDLNNDDNLINVSIKNNSNLKETSYEIDECTNDLEEILNNEDDDLFYVLNDDSISMQPISDDSNNAPINENIIGIDHNTSNILDIDIAYIIENAIKKATKPILTQVTILQKTLDKVITNQQITDQKISLLCASNKKMRPISCPIQKLPSSLERIFPLQNNVQVTILKSFLDSDKNSEMDIINYLRHQIMVKNPNVEKVTSCRATVSCLEALISKKLTMQYTFRGKGKRLNFHDTPFYYLTKQATSGFRSTDIEEIKFECTVENYVKHAKRDVEKEEAKLNEENAKNN